MRVVRVGGAVEDGRHFQTCIVGAVAGDTLHRFDQLMVESAATVRTDDSTRLVSPLLGLQRLDLLSTMRGGTLS